MRLPQTFPLIFSLSLSHDRPSATQIRHSSTGLEPGWGLCDTKFSDLSFNLAMHSTFYLALLLLPYFFLSTLLLVIQPCNALDFLSCSLASTFLLCYLVIQPCNALDFLPCSPFTPDRALEEDVFQPHRSCRPLAKANGVQFFNAQIVSNPMLG